MRSIYRVGRGCVLAGLAIAGLAGSALAQSMEHGRINVVQNDAENTTASVTLTKAGGTSNFSIRGGNRGDYDVQFSANAANDVANGVMISSIRENGRDNALAPNVGGNRGSDQQTAPLTPDGKVFATSAVDSSAAGYFIPVFSAGAGAEFNTNVAAGYFRYDSFLCGWAKNEVNNGTITAAASKFSNGINFGTEFIQNPDTTSPNGTYTLNLNTLTGNLASQNGILLVTGGKNEDNFALSQANADGTFTIFCHDNGADAANYENDAVSFVYMPTNTMEVLTGGRVTDAASPIVSAFFNNAGNATVTRTASGQYLLQIAGQTDASGTLLISAEGGQTNNRDNIVTYAWDSVQGGWLIETRDIGTNTFGANPQNLAGQVAFSYLFMPDSVAAPEPSTGALVLVGVFGMAGGALYRLRRRKK